MNTPGAWGGPASGLGDPSPVRGNRALWAWLAQRVSGLFLAYALAVHLWAVHVVARGDLSWETITARLQDDTSWTVYYLLFIPAAVFHAANGIWSVLLDYDPPPGLRAWLLAALWGGGLALLVYGYAGIRPLL